MTNSNWGKRLWLLAATACVVGLGATEARADWGSSGGSWGGSSGGSSGGSWGGSSGGSSGGRLFGGSNGGPIRNLIGRVRDRHASSGGGTWGGSSGGSSGGGRLLGGLHRHGSSGGYASSGGNSIGGSSGGHRYYSASSGGSTYGSSGGYSSSGSWQSSSMYGSAPYYSPQVISSPSYGDVYSPYSNGFDGGGMPVESTPVDLTPNPGPGSTGTEVEPTVDGDTAILNLRLPADAVVYVNGKQTRTPGEFRSYVSRNLQPGKRYTYEVRAEVNQGGAQVARTKVVHLTAGVRKTVDINFDESRQMVTSVTLLVPDDAQVTLAGADTTATGSMRYFSTTGLKQGEKWEDYKVAVTVNRDGKDVTQERVVRLTAGESLKLDFDFEMEGKLASR